MLDQRPTVLELTGGCHDDKTGHPGVGVEHVAASRNEPRPITPNVPAVAPIRTSVKRADQYV